MVKKIVEGTIDMEIFRKFGVKTFCLYRVVIPTQK